MARPVKSRTRVFFEYWLPVLAYVALIITLSAQPGLKPPFQFENSDKWIHLLEYGGLGFVVARALRVSMPGRDPLTAALMTLGFGIVMATGDEIFQSYVPGRQSSHLDAMADVAGVIVMMAFYMTFTRD